jgi:hypothetical protein
MKINILLFIFNDTDTAHTVRKSRESCTIDSGKCSSVAAAAGNDFRVADGSAMVVLRVGVVCVRIVLFYLTYNLPQKVVDFALRWQHLFIDLAHNQGHGPHLN